VQTAQRLGFTRQRLSSAGQSVLLSSPGGERLALDREASGRVVLHGSEPATVKRLLRRHTADRVVDHLRAKGVSVRVATVTGGDLQIDAREADIGQRDGQARVRARLGADGAWVVDVSGIRGSRCTQIVEELAQATDCRVTSGVAKDEAFELPGEPTVVKRRV
jgi:DNA-binding IclR family transcriptional regulator